jgi:hypothetical protein
VAPYTSEDIVKLNVDSTEGQEPCHDHLGNRSTVPGKWRDFTGVLGGTGWRLEFNFTVFTGDATKHKQWECDECPDQEDNNDGSEWKCSCSTVDNCNCVEEAECQEEWPTEEAPCQNQVSYLQIKHQISFQLVVN